MSVFDLLMRMAEIGIHEILWSEDLLAELRRVWDRERTTGRRVPGPQAAEAAFAGVRRTFPRGEVPRAAYEDLIAGLPGTDPDDKQHVAAAVAGKATHLVTDDAAGGFPVDEIARLGVTVQGADEYLASVARDFPEEGLVGLAAALRGVDG